MVFALLLLILVAAAGARLWGWRAGLLASLSLATMAEFLEIANRAGPDGMLTFFVALGGIQLIGIAGEDRVRSRRALLLGLATGGAFLAKNLLGPVFLFLILLPVLVWRRDLLRSGAAWTGAALGFAALVLVVLPWLLLLGLREPDLLHDLFWKHTLGRFFSSGNHDPDILEFSGRVLLDLLPWTPLLGPAIWRAGRIAFARVEGGAPPPGEANRSANRVLLAWIALPALLVFSSGSKRDLYLLSVYPALALVLGAFLDGVLERPAARIPALLILVVAGLALPAMSLLAPIWIQALPGVLFPVLVYHLYLLYRWIRRRGWRDLPGTCRTAMVLLCLAVVSGNILRYRIQDPYRSFLPLANELLELRGRGYTVGGYRLGLREVSAVGYYLADRFTNYEDLSGAEAFLGREAPPAALVVSRKVFDREESRPLQDTPVKIPFLVSRGVMVLLNRPPGPE